jgi:hypothetical protein
MHGLRLHTPPHTHTRAHTFAQLGRQQPHLHVTSVWSRAVHREICKPKHAKQLGDWRVFEHRDSAYFREEEVVQVPSLCFLPKDRHDGGLRALRWVVHRLEELLDLLLVHLLRRNDVLFDELDDGRADLRGCSVDEVVQPGGWVGGVRGVERGRLSGCSSTEAGVVLTAVRQADIRGEAKHYGGLQVPRRAEMAPWSGKERARQNDRGGSGSHSHERVEEGVGSGVRQSGVGDMT